MSSKLKKGELRTTLYNKITRPILLLWVGAIALLLILLAVFTNVIVLPAIEELSLDMLEAKADSISYFLDSQTEQLKRIGNMLDADEEREESLQRLKFLDQVEDSYESLGIVDRGGVVHVTSDIQFSIANRDYYRQIEASGEDAVLSEPVVSRENDELIVLILCRLPGEDEQKVYISGAINTEYIRQVLEQFNTFGFRTEVVRDEDGAVIMSTGRQAKTASQSYGCPIAAWPGWSLRLEIPDDFLYRQLLVLNGIFAVVAVLICMISSALLKRIAARTVKPIERLAQIMDGSHLRRLEPAEVDADTREVARLTDSYNSMVENTEHLMRELEQEEIQKKDAEYKALIQQIKPHFLYNTLEMIQSMCLDYEDDTVENAIGLLADFFRSSLSGDRFLIPLKEELHQVEDYLKLQLLRYEGQFDYEIYDGTGGENLFMRFTLQPIVENAIYHGVKHSGQKERITIRCRREEDRLVVMVENTCRCCDSAKIRQLDRLFATEADGTRYPGYGLYNVNSRLKLHFGAGSLLHMEEIDGAVRVMITHPILSDPGRGDLSGTEQSG